MNSEAKVIFSTWGETDFSEAEKQLGFIEIETWITTQQKAATPDQLTHRLTNSRPSANCHTRNDHPYFITVSWDLLCHTLCGVNIRWTWPLFYAVPEDGRKWVMWSAVVHAQALRMTLCEGAITFFTSWLAYVVCDTIKNDCVYSFRSVRLPLFK